MSMFVIDNNESYSDHCIYFVETEHPREVVETVAALARMSVVGEVRPVWWEGETETLASLLRLSALFGPDNGLDDRARWLPLVLLVEVRDATTIPAAASNHYDPSRARHRELSAWIEHRLSTAQSQPLTDGSGKTPVTP